MTTTTEMNWNFENKTTDEIIFNLKQGYLRLKEENEKLKDWAKSGCELVDEIQELKEEIKVLKSGVLEIKCDDYSVEKLFFENKKLKEEICQLHRERTESGDVICDECGVCVHICDCVSNNIDKYYDPTS